MIKVLVTGAAGFIGSRYCARLLQEGMSVTGIDNFDPFYPKARKLENLRPLRAAGNFIFIESDILSGLDGVEGSFDMVVHFAAKAGVRPSLDAPADYIRVNIAGTEKVHEFLIKRGIKKFIFASSSSVYGNSKKIPFAETDVITQPVSPYAFTKIAGELMNYTLHHLYETDVINLRFFTVYGPGQRPDLAIHNFVQRVYAGKEIKVFGDGSTYRDYTYIDDITEGVFLATKYCLGGKGIFETVNLGNNSPVRLNELLEVIFETTGRRAEIRNEPAFPGDVNRTLADISKASRLFGYKPVTDIRAGIKSFVNWYTQL